MLVFMSVFWLVWDLLGMTMTAAGGILVNNAVSNKIDFSDFFDPRSRRTDKIKMLYVVLETS